MQNHVSPAAENSENPIILPENVSAGTLPPPYTEETSESLGQILWRWLLARNPLYILSAGLMLFGLYRLVLDPKVFADEVGQLTFNFGSLQFYELLLVGTSILLFRRKIFYDSTLLFSLENLFVFIPFLLLSQAALNDAGLGVSLSVFAGAMVLLRFKGLQKYLKNLDLSPRLLGLGLVLLVTNVGVPWAVRALRIEVNQNTWEMRRDAINQVLWIAVVPALLGLANLLPRVRRNVPAKFTPVWLPLALFTLWTVVTITHLYSIGYVYELIWKPALAAPVIWVAAWTFYVRRTDLMAELSPSTRNGMLLLPIIALLPALPDLHLEMLFSLALLNLLLYTRLFLIGRDRYLFNLAGASLVLAVCVLPPSLMETLHVQLSRAECIGGAISCYLVLRALLSCDPRWTIGGAVGVIMGATGFFDAREFGLGLAFQAACIFFLAHSLRWEDAEHPGSRAVRRLAAFVWFIESCLWMNSRDAYALPTTLALAAALLGICVAVWLIFRKPIPRVVPLTAGLIALLWPAQHLLGWLKDAPAGVLAVFGSFLLFAGGTAFALLKPRFQNSPAPKAQAPTAP